VIEERLKYADKRPELGNTAVWCKNLGALNL